MSEARGFYNTLDPQRWGRDEMPEAFGVTSHWLARGLHPDGPVLELGCGRGALAAVSPQHVGLDLAFPALLDVRRHHVTCGDMEQLPFANASIAFVFSWAAIEHVPHPERVLGEVVRVLKPRGLALLAPAWHCRPWAAEGLEFRPYAELRPTQKLRKAILPFRNHVAWRAAFELPRRVVRELAARPTSFTYRRLRPNLDTYLGTDSDAFTSMDPHEMALFFATRGWAVLSHPTRRARMLARSEPVVVQKPA